MQQNHDDDQKGCEHIASVRTIEAKVCASLVPQLIEEKVNVSDDFSPVRTSKPKELVESVETLDKTVG